VGIPTDVKEVPKNGASFLRWVRVSLVELAWKIRIGRMVEKWDRLLGGVKPSLEGFSVGSVRENRESH
jgi:hypothetical protein